MIPLYHDFEGERVVIVGGGPVALRKARRFATEATVTVVAPSFEDGFASVACERRREAVEPDEIPVLVADAALVVPATDDTALNDEIAAAAEQAGALVNHVDRTGDVVVPATVDAETVSLAVSTGGASPATSRWLRQQLEPTVERADRMARLQRDLRAELKTAVETQAERRRLLRAVIDADEVWDRLEDGLSAGKSAADAVISRER
ncbi:MAG: bifunctional precorrin-2 dehydrogenase/sirohydrochlorin ferrochelatase [Halolamina sp.]